MPTDRCVVVTGGASGLGLAVAEAAAGAGANVAIVDVQEATAQEVAGRIGATAYGCDLRRVATIAPVFENINRDLGRIDVLVNCAGIANRTPIEDITETEWDLSVDVNLKGLFFASQAAYRVMLKQRSGTIINLASIRGYISDGRHAIYDATKSAVHALTRTFAVAGGPHGITTNSVSPAYVLTPMTRHNLSRPGWLESMIDHVPIGRLMSEEDVTNVVLFLASDKAAGLNGRDFVVDGGWLAGGM